MTGQDDKPKVGDKVVLVALPPGLLDGLTEEDQRAISAWNSTIRSTLGPADTLTRTRSG